MLPSKQHAHRLLKANGLWAIAFLLLLNARGDEPTRNEEYAKIYKLTPEQLLVLKNLEPELTNEYNMALKSPEGASQFQAVLRKAMLNIDAASIPIATNGEKLPASFVDIFVSKHEGTFSDSIDRANGAFMPGFMGLGPNDYADQLTLNWGGQLTNSAPDIVMPLLKERANVFPPTATDYILYSTVTGFMLAKEISDENLIQAPLSSSAGLLTMAKARNPICRSMAARLFRFWEPKDTTPSRFYAAYLNETDPIILAFIIDALGTDKGPDSITLLQSFEPAIQKTGDAKLEAHLKNQIQRQKFK
jgi:hypothetical protein